MKHVVIVYNPGYAGNFLQRLFSINTDVVPAFYKEELATKQSNISGEHRMNKYLFSHVRDEFENWQKFHRGWTDMHEYYEILNVIDKDEYEYIVFAMHEVEYQLFKKRQIKSKNYATIYFPNNTLFLGVELDLIKYNDWVQEAQQDLQFMYRLEEKYYYNKYLNSIPLQCKINLTKILDSYDGFCEEYNRICKIIGLIPDMINATLLYEDWYNTRVSCYLK